MPQRTTYRIYIVSLWPEPAPSASGAAQWRFRVEDPHTGVQYGFGSAAALVDFLAAPEQSAPNPLAPNDFQMIDGYAADIGDKDTNF